MAYRKASDEQAAVALGSDDFWAAVQNGGDVRISVADILAYLRTVLVTGDIAELPGKLKAISDKAAGDVAAISEELDAALGQLNGSVAQSIEDLEANVETRATKAEVEAALGTLDGSVGDKLDALQIDVDRRVLKSQLGSAAGQVPVLDAGGKLDVSTIPAVAITDTFPVASQADMLALDAERGDIAIRSDLNKCFILKAEPATVLANWKELLTPTDAVLSVAGLVGAITATGLKAALAIAISDVAGLQGALDALSAADAKLRTDFAAADAAEAKARADADTLIRTDFAAADAAEAKVRAEAVTAEAQARSGADAQIRTDFAAADAAEAKARADANALKFDKTGGNVSGNVLASGTVQGNAVQVQSSGDAIVTVESLAAPTTSFRRKQIFSSNNVAGGNNWLFRQTRPSDGFYEDFYLTSGTGGTIWTTGNFNPATKANLSGAGFTGNVSVRPDPSYGYATVVGGSPDRTGYVEFRGKNDVRQAYIGWGDGNQVDINAENGAHYNFNVAPTVGGATLWHPGNFNPATKLGLATGGMVTAPTVFQGNVSGAGVSNRSGDGSFLQVRSDDGGAAAMTFHRAGQYATWFGLDNDNEFVRGGWSDGLTRYKFWTQKNFDPNSRVATAGGSTISGQTNIVNGGSLRFLNPAADTNDGKIGYKLFGDGLNIVGAANSADNGQRYLTLWGYTRVNGSIVSSGAIRSESGDFHTHRGNASGYIFFGNGDNQWFGSNGTSLESSAGTMYLNGVEVTRQNQYHVASGYGMTGGEAYIYQDSGAHNIVLRTGSNADGYFYPNFNNKGFLTTYGVRSYGDLVTTGRVIVGEGATQSYIEMRDTDEGTRYLHNNSSSIGFLNRDAGWVFRVFDDGNWWSSRNGYLSDIVASIDAKAAKFTPTVGNGIRVEANGGQGTSGAWPYLSLWKGGYWHWQFTVNDSSQLVVRNGDDGSNRFVIGTSGEIWSAQFGDLNSRIEDRASAHANAAANGRLSSMRFVYAGDLGNDWNYTGGFGSPYGGYACMVDRATQPEAGFGGQFVKVLRWRYLQMYLPTTGWITVTAAS